MTRLFKALALLIAIACVVWVGVLWRWQATQRDMSSQDIATYLVALPLTLFVLVLLARWAWRGATARAAVTAAAGSAQATGAGAAATAQAAPVVPPLLLLTAHVHCAAGHTPEAVLAAAAEGQPRPQLDPALVDDDGMPLLTARITALDLDALDLSAALADVQASQAAQQSWAGAAVADTTLRALAALLPPLQASLAGLQPWRHRFGLADGGTAPPEWLRPPTPSSGGPALRQSNLRVLPSWPTDWPAFDTAVANAWLLRQLVEADVAAPDRIQFVAAAQGRGADRWLQAERLVQPPAPAGQGDVVLLAACHSAIGVQAVQRLQDARQLYTARSPKQPVPGEGAVALALAPAGWAALDATWPPDAAVDTTGVVTLHRAAVARRDQAVDVPGRASAQAAQACIAQALAAGAAPTPAAAPPDAGRGADATATATAAAAVHDADQHTARAAEALTALIETLPALQPADDVLQTGALNGQLGVAAVPLVVALAAAQAQALQQPCLALSVDDGFTRLALLARPGLPAASAPVAADAAGTVGAKPGALAGSAA